MAYNTWTRKTDIPITGTETGHFQAVPFTLSTSAYWAGGIKWSTGTLTATCVDVFAYNLLDGTWSTKGTQYPSVSNTCIHPNLTLSGKAYSLGHVTTNANFYEYDPVGDTWTQKAAYGGTSRIHIVAGGVDGWIYAGTGRVGGAPLTDWWGWNSGDNTWTQKASIGAGSIGAGSMTIAGNIYRFGGNQTGSDFVQTMNMYSPSGNAWSSKASYPIKINYPAVCATEEYGYSFSGQTVYPSTSTNKFYQYDPVGNAWDEKATIGATGYRVFTSATAYGKDVFIGGGYSDAGATYYNDWWRWDGDPSPPPSVGHRFVHTRKRAFDRHMNVREDV